MRAPTWVNGCAVLGTTDCPASRPLPTAQGVAAQVMSGELTCKVVTFIKNRNVTESYSLHEPNTGERPATWRRPTVAGCLRLRAAFLFVCHARACRHTLRIAACSCTALPQQALVASHSMTRVRCVQNRCSASTLRASRSPPVRACTCLRCRVCARIHQALTLLLLLRPQMQAQMPLGSWCAVVPSASVALCRVPFLALCTPVLHECVTFVGAALQRAGEYALQGHRRTMEDESRRILNLNKARPVRLPRVRGRCPRHRSGRNADCESRVRLLDAAAAQD